MIHGRNNKLERRQIETPQVGPGRFRGYWLAARASGAPRGRLTGY